MLFSKKLILIVSIIAFTNVLLKGQSTDTVQLNDKTNVQYIPSSAISRFSESFNTIQEAIGAYKKGLFEKGDTIISREKKIWFKFYLKNASTSIQDWQLGIVPFETYQVYIIEGKEIDSVKNGLNIPNKQKADELNPSHIFFKLSPNRVATIFIALLPNNKPDITNKNLKIHIHNAKISKSLQEFIWLQIGIFIGVIGVMTAYNTALFVFIRDRSYLYYVIILVFFGIYFLAIEGVIDYVFNTTKNFNGINVANHCTQIFSLAMIQFTRHYFNTKQNFLKWDKVFKIFIVLFFSFTILELTPVYADVWVNYINLSSNILITIGMIIMLAFSIYAYSKKFEVAKYYLLANTLFFLFALYYLTQPKYFNLLPATLLGELSLKVGILLQMIIFSLALAARINILRRLITEKKLEKELLEKQQILEIQKITEQKNAELEVKVIERTQELKETVEELHQIVEKLDMTNEALKDANKQLARKNMDITDSINYASRIQRAMLPLQENIDRILPQNFIFYKPRDIVAGDFYWIQEVKGRVIVAAADCTGHGVPGALMSMISHELLNEIILTKNILQANAILNELHYSIQKALKQEETQNLDGLDIALIVWDKTQKKLSFAGANNSLILIQNGELKEIPADKYAIGGMQHQTNRNFTLQEVAFDENNPFLLYLCSDGYQDQFGGTQQKKFLKSKFKQLLLTISPLDMPKQREHLEINLQNWQGKEEQTDDILVIGLRINPKE